MPEPTPPGTSKKIIGLPKWAFFTILAVGLILAYYLYRKNQNTQSAATPSATDSIDQVDTSGLTSADIGGTPSDSGTVYQPGAGTDYSAQLDALTAQIQQSEQDLTSQISSISAAGVGTSVASAPQTGDTTIKLPITVVTVTQKMKAKAKPKPKAKPKAKKK